ncbi:hypothetical protein PUNSTDRAFT_100354 [Punctularia strigosozonata HHB-11173 SS5]|uniref:uncharacterized protein n=1 Tax=Punctularia strigosozonata (strain HHB-11173) TaxID=741275 RepID=UPI00044168B2|nr:uncharacterized protein PUNSTDRAFT_100354 [Punctularia strigosozonata HHB-11173 SS5]EIN10665.1 hypothetical protein PUNSTDRAFT_100354 [Punctularia strigosozonata HHB-11173 SS5]
MSSISFPHSGAFGASSGSSSVHDDAVFSPSFEPSGSSFQMNPLSQHPPRTPRTSIISNAASTNSTQVYGQEIYGAKGDNKSEHEAESVDEEPTTPRPRKKVRHETIWKEVLSTSYGRDKTLKLLQYSIRVYLLVHTTLAATAALRKPTGRSWEVEIVKRLESTAAGFSLTRKCLILFNWLHPLHSIMDQHHASSDGILGKSKTAAKPLLHTVLHAPPPVLLELLNAVSDDLATFSKLGLLGKRTGDRAARLSDWCWFASTLVNLVENAVERSVIIGLQHEVESRLYTESMTGTTSKSIPASKHDEKELQRLQKKDYWLQITRAKLLMDLVFVSYDVFKMKKAKAPMQAITGLASAVLSTAKLYNNHKLSLIKPSNPPF